MLKSPLIAAVAAFLLFPGIGKSAEVKLLASGAIKDAYLELLPEFERATRHKVIAAWSSTTDIQKRVAGGEVADLVTAHPAPGKRPDHARRNLELDVTELDVDSRRLELDEDTAIGRHEVADANEQAARIAADTDVPVEEQHRRPRAFAR